MNKDSFIFYKDWANVIKELPDDIRLEVYDAVIEYGISGKQTDLKPMAKIAFGFIKQMIDRNNEKYKSISDLRSEAGKKGAEKRWQTMANNGKNSKSYDKDKDKGNDKDKEDKQYVPRLSRGEYFIQLFNNLKGEEGKPTGYKLNDKVDRQLKARINEGYTSKDFEKAIINCKRDPHHRETGLKYLTPEFITRPDKLELYLNGSNTAKKQKLKTGML